MTTFQHSSRARRQAGAASLIVVMVLFFVISMVAAYTNRNLIFEQKTSVNQSRSTRALEAADAGVEWALSLLNTGRITAACQTSAVVADTSFRDRYLDINDTSGNIKPKKRGDGVTDLYPTCVYDGTNWNCHCPTDADPVVAAPAGNDIFPAFRVRFRRVCALPTAPDTACAEPVQPGVVHIDVNGCTTLNEDCLRFAPAPVPVPGEGRATVHVVAALRSALPAQPVAALTARGAVDPGFSVTNSVTADGITVHAGGAISVPAFALLQGKAGTPADQTIVNDATLPALSTDQYFASVLGLWRNTFREQPAAIELVCAVSCSAATLRSKVALNPGRVYWVVGDLDLDSAGDIGTAAEPVFINVTGNVTFSSPVTIYGAVYSQAATWITAGAGSIVGAAFGEGAVTGGGTTDIRYDLGVITRLRTRVGSFVRVPGTWRDFDT